MITAFKPSPQLGSRTFRALWALLLTIACSVAPRLASAQFEQSCSVTFMKDSMIANSSTSFLYNSVSLQNTTGQGIKFNVYVFSGPGWRTLAAPFATYELAPGQTEVLPLSVMKKTDANARWIPITIGLQFQGRVDTFFHSFQVKTVEQTGFVAVSDESSVELQPDEDSVQVPLRIKNLGNSTSGYRVKWKLGAANVQGSERLELGPKRDTTYYVRLSLSKSQLARLKKERLNVEVQAANGDVRAVDYTVSRLNFKYAQNEHAYLQMPLLLELGVNRYSGFYSYYGGVSGTLALGQDHSLSMFVRRDYIPANQISPRPIYQFDYRYKRLSLNVGQAANHLGQFFGGGRSVGITYRLGRNADNSDPTYISLTAGLPDRFISSRLYGAAVRYRLRGLTVAQSLDVCFDTLQATSGIALSNSLGIRRENWGFVVEGGSGIGLVPGPRVNLERVPGFYGGGSFYAKRGAWAFESSGLLGSKNMPGRNRNRELLTATLSWKWRQLSASAIYMRSYSQFSSRFDSVGQINFASFSTSKYGINLGAAGQRMGAYLFVGYLTEQTINNSTLPRYKAASFDYSLKISRYSKFGINSLIGYADESDGVAKENAPLILNTSRAFLSFKYGGFQANYIKRPYYAQEQLVIQENLSYGPFLSIAIANGLQARAGYTITDFGRDNVPLHNVSASLSYASRNGAVVAVNGQINSHDLGNDITNNSLTLSIRKPLNIPVPFTKKVANLKVVLYQDLNLNGVHDDGEPFLANQKVYINESGFLTNRKGQVFFKNVDNGKYIIDLREAAGTVGIIPVGGVRHELYVSRNMQYQIGYIKSRIIQGQLFMKADSVDRAKFTVARYKVIATDTIGNEYATLTDADGKFSINVPSGSFLVSLNREAFGQSLVPNQYAFNVDVMHTEVAEVNFTLQAKKRALKMVDLGNSDFSISSKELNTQKKKQVKSARTAPSNASAPNVKPSANDKQADATAPPRDTESNPAGLTTPERPLPVKKHVRHSKTRKFPNPAQFQNRSYPMKVSRFEAGMNR